SGSWNSFTVLPPDAGAQYSFIKSDPTFKDLREGKFTQTTEIDVAAFYKWMTNSGPNSVAVVNSKANFQLGHQLTSIYMNDQRPDNTKLTVVRVINGQQLPPDGLT